MIDILKWIFSGISAMAFIVLVGMLTGFYLKWRNREFALGIDVRDKINLLVGAMVLVFLLTAIGALMIVGAAYMGAL